MSDLNKALEIMKEHQRLDRLAQGAWIRDDEGVVEGQFRGCFYGCAMQTDDDPIEKFCKKYDMPLWIGCWSEKVFEGLPEDEAKQWPVQLLQALVDFDGDLKIIKHKLAVRRLTSLLNDDFSEEANEAIRGVIDCHEKAANGEADIDWESAVESAAYSAASSAASSVSWQNEREWMLEILSEDE